MPKVFASIEVSEAVLVRDALRQQGFDASIQNRYSGYTAIPAFRPPAEVWVPHGADLAAARKIVRETLGKLDDTSADRQWLCPDCEEQNPGSFDICWNCERAKPTQGGS